MHILSVKFKSPLTLDQVLKISDDRAPRFCALPGLIQKYYGYEPSTGEYTGIYLWDSEESLRIYRDSELARSIPEAYQVDGRPRIEIFEVPYILRS